MRPEPAIGPIEEHDAAVIERAVEDVVAHVAPAGRGQRAVHVREFKVAAHLFDAHLHQPRIAVRAAAFICDPIGAQVAFLEDMHPQPALLRLFDGQGMDGARVAIKHDVGDALVLDQPGQGAGPVLGAVAVGDIGGPVAPERPVARVEAHAPYLGPRAAQHNAEPGKERSVRSLKEQKHTVRLPRVRGHIRYCPVLLAATLAPNWGKNKSNRALSGGGCGINP